MRRSLLLILLITISFVSNALGASPENPLLRDLNNNATLTLLNTIYTDGNNNYVTLNSVGPAIYFGFKARNMTMVAAGTRFNLKNHFSDSNYLMFILENRSIENIYTLTVFLPQSETMTVRDFNQLMQGKLLITLNETPEESEGRPIHQLELPAKIKFEEEQRLLPQETKLIFNHPKNKLTKIIIKFNEKSGRTRVIPKGTAFEIVDADFDTKLGLSSTVLTVNSKDIALIDFQTSGHTPFTTNDFYTIMGTRASLIQNTDPPLPVK